jgi:hypothetical protein
MSMGARGGMVVHFWLSFAPGPEEVADQVQVSDA